MARSGVAPLHNSRPAWRSAGRPGRSRVTGRASGRPARARLQLRGAARPGQHTGIVSWLGVDRAAVPPAPAPQAQLARHLGLPGRPHGPRHRPTHRLQVGMGRLRSPCRARALPVAWAGTLGPGARQGWGALRQGLFWRASSVMGVGSRCAWGLDGNTGRFLAGGGSARSQPSVTMVPPTGGSARRQA